MPTASTITQDFRKLLAFGTGVGIEIGAADLEVAVTRVRPNGIQVLGRMTIEDYATRPAAEWGVDYAQFLHSSSSDRLSATVLLPRREVIVRQVALPGVADRDIEGAIRFQMDSLHPYGDDEIVWGWSPLAYGNVLVGILRRAAMERYVAMFVEAGIAVRSFTFSAAAVHAAIRLNGTAQAGEGFIALSRTATGALEVYGESRSRPLFSSEFELAPSRAVALALSELRLAPDTAPHTLEEILPKPTVNPVTNDLSRNALPYAAGLAGACPHLAPAANLLPEEHRRSNSRAVFIPTAVLAALLLLLAASMAVYASWSEKQYLQQLNAEIASIEPLVRHGEVVERETRNDQARALLLDQFRKQTRLDLDALNALTHLVEYPAWSNAIDLSRDSARISGEGPQTAPLLKILDSSPYFEKTEIMAAMARGNGETFQIRTNRRKGK